MSEMLSELYSFNGIKKASPPKKTEPKKEKITKQKSRNTKQQSENLHDESSVSLELKKEEENISLANKIKQWNLEEERKKKQKEKLLNELHKTKKINLKKFLNRTLNYEQKKQYNIEMRKIKQLQNERDTLLDHPTLSKKTYDLCKEKKKKPLYLRTNEVIEERNKEIENLSKIYMLPKAILDQQKSRNAKFNFIKKYKSVDNNNTILSTTNRKITAKEMNSFYLSQERWYENKENKIQNKKMIIDINKENNESTFHPVVNQTTIEYDTNKISQLSQSNHQLRNKSRRTNSLDRNYNNKETVFDKLYKQSEEYNDRLQAIQEQYSLNFVPCTNKRKNKKIASKYYNIFLNKSTDNIDKNKSKNESKSVDFDEIKVYSIKNNQKIIKNNLALNKKNNNKSIDVVDENKVKNKMSNLGKNDWTKTLLKLEKEGENKNNDYTYHLNVMDSGAWNENSVNQVRIHPNSKYKNLLIL